MTYLKDGDLDKDFEVWWDEFNGEKYLKEADVCPLLDLAMRLRLEVARLNGVISEIRNNRTMIPIEEQRLGPYQPVFYKGTGL